MLISLLLQIMLALSEGSFSGLLSNRYIPIHTFSGANQSQMPPKRQDSDVLDVLITAKSAIAVDQNSGTILYSKDPNKQQPIASITKLMTALVYLDNQGSLSQTLRMSQADRHSGGIQHFNIGDDIQAMDVLSTMLVASDNEAAYILARNYNGGVEAFVKAMNAKAKALGMSQTSFGDPSGLDPKNVSSAEDLVKLLQVTAENKIIAAITKKSKIEFQVVSGEKKREVVAYTTDALATNTYLTLLTGKTGYLPEAGYCLATKLVSQKGREMYFVVLNSDNILDRFQDVKAIEYYISQNYQ